ncbi:ATP-binding cassette domain-containing protein [Microcoleus sp. Aus8_D2]|uniref:ABC transporter ATP-binding protein n=1 Tax=Microcoleus sp. Aus8_D2 TaxID=2818632 RepID=UPI003FA5CEC4
MIEVEHLSKTYGSTAAIADVSFSVESGEILGFLGPNGAGKTTTMRILSGYLPASSGTARIAGLDVHENSMAVRQRIGYLPENPPLYPEMSVEGFLFFVARIKQVPAGDRARRVTSAIERCGLIEKRKVLIRKLSKGFKQRVGIAQAIVHDPPVIILDEPTVGLDPRQIIEVRNLIKSLGDQHTIILSTHILPEVSMTCNRVTIINRGQIVAAGTPEHLMGELATGEGYEVEVEGEADLLNSLLLPSLENVPGVRSVELIPSQQFLTSRYRLRALCESDIEPGRDIATAIIASGFGLCEMRRNRASLEDVFLRLTVAQQKPEESLVHSEPEVDRNLQAVAEIQDALADAHQSESQPTIADAHQSESPPIVENLLVSDRQQSLYDSDSASEPIAETVESLYDSDSASEPVVETVGSIEHHEPASEPFVETVELIEHHEPEFQSVVETVESIEYHEPESQSVVETVESIGDIEPEMQPVAEFLLLVERQGSIEHHEPEMQPVAEIVESIEHREPEMQPVVEIVESIEHREPEMQPVAEIVESIEHREPEMQPVAEILESIEHREPEPIVENLLVVETVESIEYLGPESEPVAEILESIEHREPESEPVAEILESIEHREPESEPAAQIIESIEHREPESEPVAEIIESIEHREPESEPVAETVESIEHSPPQSQPVAKNRLLKKKQQPSSDVQAEQPPATRKRQIERKPG